MFGNNKKIDFLGLGDLTVDAFIRLRTAHITSGVNKEKKEICFTFGDKIPYEFVEVVKATGNSANAATSASRLGLTAGLISDIGNDQNGKDVLDGLTKNGIKKDYVTIHKNKETNYHYILWYRDERTILVKHQEYSYKLPKFPEPKWLYVSSLAENSAPYHEQIADYLDKHPDVKLAFQPGTFQMKLGAEKLARLYKRAEIFFCNTQEAQRILNTTEKDIKELIKKMGALGPKITVITDGPRGAYAYDKQDIWFMPPYPDPKPPYERTGAGDAFASTFTSALALGKSIPEALLWGPINSMSVVQYAGAQKGLLTRKQLEELLIKAPVDYKPRKV